MKRYIMMLLIIALSINQAHASPGWQASDNVWGIIYFIGATELTLAMDHLTHLDYTESAGIAFLAIISKEITDEVYSMNKYKRSDHWFLDARGGSWQDVLVGAGGIAVAYLFRDKSVKVIVNRNMAGLSYSF